MRRKFSLIRITFESLAMGFLVFFLLGTLAFGLAVLSGVESPAFEKVLMLLVVLSGVSAQFWWFRRRWNPPPPSPSAGQR